MIKINPFIQPILKNEIAYLVILWSFIQLLAYFHFGILTPIDSIMYIENAQAILAGNWPHGRDLFYVSYSLIIAIFDLIGFGQNGVIVFQIMAAGLAMICMYCLTKLISSRPLAPLIAALLYIFWFKFQHWNLILYTDSLFTSMVIISMYVLYMVKSKLDYVLGFAVLIFTALIRPTGVGLLLAVIVYLLYDKLVFIRKNLIFNLALLLCVMVGSVYFLDSLLSQFVDSFIASYQKAEIIYPNITLGMQSPDQLYIPDQQDPALIQLGQFFLNNFSYMFQLTAIKGFLYLAHIKPYYSIWHNIFIGLVLYPNYLFAIRGIKIHFKNRLVVFIIVFILIQVWTISLTSENWDGRFLLPVLPWVFVLAALGISNWLSRKLESKDRE